MTSSSTASRSLLRRGLALTAATVTAVAMGSISSPADAGTGSEWDRLAECESHGNWDINTGNGYYGGLQFAKGSWDWAGGGQYAEYPHQATRVEQIKTAESLLDLQHLSNAWPYCSSKVGLTHAELQSGSISGGGSSSDDSSDDSSSDDSSSGGSSSGGSSSGGSSSGGSSDSGNSGSYRVQSGDTLSRIASRLDVDGGWRALYAANDDRIANPNVIRVGQTLRVPGGGGSSSSGESTGSSSNRGSYRVRSGDTLARIAAAEGVSGGWRALYRANDDRIGDPNVIYVGQVLRLP